MFIRIILWIFTTCTFALTGILSRAQITTIEGAIPGTVVRTTVSDSELDYELRSVALSANGAKIEMSIAAWPKGMRSEPKTLTWVTVDTLGQILSRQNPFKTLSSVDTAKLNINDPSAGTGLFYLRNQLLLIMPSLNRNIWLVRLAHLNELASIRTVYLGGHSPIIHRVLAANNEQIALLGSDGEHPIISQIDIEGKLITQQRLHEQAMTVINVLFEAGGNILVAGEQGTFPNATTWIGRVSPRGEVLAKTSFHGRPSAIAQGSDGTYLTIIERGSSEGSEIVAKSLAPDLSERWTRSLMSHQQLVFPFRAAPVTTGGFIISGRKDSGLWISHVKSDGVVKWLEVHNPLKSNELEMVSRVELISMQDIFVVAYTAFVVSGRQQREVVRTIRFSAN